MLIINLPNELLINIIEYLQINEIYNLKLVCKKFYELHEYIEKNNN